jgi:hypothetical protein
MANCNGVTTPIESTKDLYAAFERASFGQDAQLCDQQLYQALVGSLMYAMLGTRPDLAFSVSIFSRFNVNPTIEHYGAAKRALRYLKNTRTHGIVCQGNTLEVLAYSDSDWANDMKSRKSTNGYVFTIYNGAVTWKSRRQSTVALSSTEAEYVGYTEAAKEAIWIRGLLIELDQRIPLNRINNEHNSKWGQEPITIRVDNQGAIDLANNPKIHDRTKHIDIRHHFIREAIERRLINLFRIPTTEQTADILTKPLARTKFEEHRRGMGIMAIEDVKLE